MFTIVKTEIFEKWQNKIKDIKAKAKIEVCIRRMEVGNLGDVKAVGEGVSEARIHFGAGYRLYFCRRGDIIIVLLCGGDKSSQNKDIETAKELKKMSVTKEDCKLSKWDIVDYLDSEEAIAAYLEAAAEENDPEFMVQVINDIARARGMNELAKKMGVTREGLYKSLNGTTKPRFETICKALNALGFQFTIRPVN